MVCSPPGFSVHGFSQARILEWVAIPLSRDLPHPPTPAPPPGIDLMSPPLQADCLPFEPPEKPNPGWVWGQDARNSFCFIILVVTFHFHIYIIFIVLGFPGSSAGKESTCNAGDPGLIPGLGRSPGEGIGYPFQYSWGSLVAQMVKICPQCRRPGFDPWVGKILWRRAWQPTSVFLRKESHGQRSLADCS